MKPRHHAWISAAVLTLGILAGAIFFQARQQSLPPGARNVGGGPPSALETASGAAGTPAAVLTPGQQPELRLEVDPQGLSHSTAVFATTQGTIKYKFYSSDAPRTVTRIAELIQKGFYNGLTFHRVIPNFVVQTGDPQGTGNGGSGLKLKDEINDRPHIEGTVGMARSAEPDSADSQFYIVMTPQPHLNKAYTVFGQVIEGMDVVRKLQKGDKVTAARIE